MISGLESVILPLKVHFVGSSFLWYFFDDILMGILYMTHRIL